MGDSGGTPGERPAPGALRQDADHRERCRHDAGRDPEQELQTATLHDEGLL
jgi:hypothetical protein